MTCEEVQRLLEPYADGELAFESAIAVEAHAAACDACAAKLKGIRAVRRTLRAAPYFRAPEALAERVRTAVAAAAAAAPAPQPLGILRQPHRRWQPWMAVAASLVLVGLAALGMLRKRASLADDATAAAVIEGHLRSLMADHLTDVASTDRHTVKPWFAGRLDFSPSVADLAGDGFPLVGGRLDYIDDHPAAAMVYKRRDHTINVFVWPQAGGSPSHVTRSDARGHHVIFWARGGMAVWIVSDLAQPELEDFARRLDSAMRD
jgi:anti-sigma factor RsiW